MNTPKSIPGYIKYILPIIIIAFFMTTSPWGWSARNRLRNLSANDIKSIILSENTYSKPDSKPINLNSEEIKEFLGLISETKLYAPNHPTGDWSVFVNIDTLSDDDLYFSLHSTKNNGTYISLRSNGLDGWNYGDLRNDSLKVFIERMFNERKMALTSR